MMKQVISIAILVAVSFVAYAQSHYPGQHAGKLKIKESIGFKAKAFDMADIKLTDSRFTENTEREVNWIMSLSVKRLLHSFRNNSGVFSEYEGGYDKIDRLDGWESLDCDLRGHTTGHILSGLAMLYASTGDEKFKLKADSLVNGLAEVQEALDLGGYLSAFPPNLINRAIRREGVWAPWYTLHKLYSGLIDQYLYCNNDKALRVVSKMADWAYNKLSALTEEQRHTMLRNEFGGMNDSYYALYAITGEKNYKWLAEFFYHNATLDPLKAKEDNLNPKHANTFIPKLIGLLRAYEMGENKEYEEIANFFWNTVVDHHTFCTGSNSDKEHFFAPDNTSKHLSGYTGESCNTYNMLKMTRHLFCLHGDVKYADYYERALYNHILGQQDTKTGMIAYFLPMLPGAHKVYSTPDSSFWCCVGSGFENHAKYGEAIYYHTDNELFVNLFIPSELNWEAKGMKLKQESEFPKSGKSTLTISTEKAVKFALKLRFPAWAEKAEVKINGKKQRVRVKPGSYIVLNRHWKTGDKVELEFPMEVQVYSTPENPSVIAFTYGPIVLAAKLGTEGMQKPAPYSNPDLHNDYYKYKYHVPSSISNELNLNKKKAQKWLKQTKEGELIFKGTDPKTGKEFTFIPLYDLHRERYNVYWELK